MPLTKGKYAIVDAEDYERIVRHKWYYDGYAMRDVYENGKKRKVLMHRVVIGYDGDMDVDHINRDKLDNRKCNLRVVSRSVNLMNRGKTVKNKSGFKGVSWHKATKKWAAFIRFNNQKTALGIFDDVHEAAAAYNAAYATLITLTTLTTEDTNTN